MVVETLLENYRIHQALNTDEVRAIRTDANLRADLVEHLRAKRDRPFALALLNKFIDLRKDCKNEISIDDLMLGSFLLGIHGRVEDSLKVWEAKQLDFDTYCGIDIQLVAFAGVDKTISFLRVQTGNDAKEALKYVLACSKAGDFDDLEGYYKETPWWI